MNIPNTNHTNNTTTNVAISTVEQSGELQGRVVTDISECPELTTICSLITDVLNIQRKDHSAYDEKLTQLFSVITPHSIAALPQSLQTQLRVSTLNEDIKNFLKLQTAYKEKQTATIIELENKFGNTGRQNLIRQTLRIRAYSDSTLSLAITHYNNIIGDTLCLDTFPTSLSITECKERISIIEHTHQETPTNRNKPWALLTGRIRLEEHYWDGLFDPRLTTISLDDFDEAACTFFAEFYGISNWQCLWIIGELYMRLYHSYQEYKTLQPGPSNERHSEREHQQKELRDLLSYLLSEAGFLQEHYDTICDLLFHHVSSPLGSFITSVNTAINYANAVVKLERCLGDLEKPANASTEQQNQYIATARALIQNIEAILDTEAVPQHLLDLMVDVTRNTTYNAAFVMRYTAALKRLQAQGIDAATRLQLIWDLSADIPLKTTQLHKLYPECGALVSQICYATLIRSTSQDSSRFTFLQSIVGADTVAFQLTTDECNTLYTQLREHIRDFDTKIPDHATVVARLHTDMDVCRYIQRYNNTPRTIVAHSTRITILNKILELSTAFTFGWNLLNTMDEQYELILEALYHGLTTNTHPFYLTDNLSANTYPFYLTDNIDAIIRIGRYHAKGIVKSSLTGKFRSYLQRCYPLSQEVMTQIECMTAYYLLDHYQCEAERTSTPEQLSPIHSSMRTCLHDIYKAAHQIDQQQYKTLLSHLADPPILDSRPRMKRLINEVTTGEFECNFFYKLSDDHYNRVRYNSSIAPLAATINSDSALRTGLVTLFNSIPFSRLQLRLDAKTMTQESATTDLNKYIDSINNMACLIGAPPEANIEARREFWGNVKNPILHVISYLESTQLPFQELTTKKIKLLATIISGAGFCATRYIADAIDLYQQIVLNKPITFESVIARELSGIREANAHIISEGEAHQFMALLRLAGQELAIPGTETLGRYDDPFYTQTQLYGRYENNRAALKKRFEELYTPFALASCIRQEVGPQGREDARELFRKWCYDTVRVPDTWGKDRKVEDWGRYFDDIQDLDTAKNRLQELREAKDAGAFLSSHRIQRRNNETAEQALLKVHSIRIQANETAAQAIERCMVEVLKLAYLDTQIYETPPVQWTLENRPLHLKVKISFIADMLARMGLLQALE